MKDDNILGQPTNSIIDWSDEELRSRMRQASFRTDWTPAAIRDEMGRRTSERQLTLIRDQGKESADLSKESIKLARRLTQATVAYAVLTFLLLVSNGVFAFLTVIANR